MTRTLHFRRLAAGTALAALAWTAGALGAERTVDEHRAAEAAGQVEIQDVAGRVEVVGWDKAEVAVGGTIGAEVERVEVSSAGARTTVRTVTRESHFGFGQSSGGDTHLVVHIPQRSSLTTSLVSADLSVAGVAGNQELHTVSGEVSTAAQRELRARTVSGRVRVSAGPEARFIEISTVSGDVTVTGGAGELAVATVSGDGKLSTGLLTRAHLKTVSGAIAVSADLAPDGRLEAESVSGNFRIDFTGSLPPALFELQSFSGDLSTCSGRKGVRDSHGPGSRLSFQEGAGTARVRVDTKSGDVRLCSRS